jgi:hypothetical protein
METELNQRLQKLENKMDQILKLLNKNSSVEDKKTTVKEAKPKVERKPSAFNQFMKKQIETLKTEKPDLDHKVVSRWPVKCGQLQLKIPKIKLKIINKKIEYLFK